MCGTPTICAMTFPEQILVWSMRRWAERPSAWPAVEATFRHALGGATGRIAAGALDHALFILSRHGRAPFFFQRLDCPMPAPGESDVIALIAANQLGDRHHAETTARALLKAPYDRIVLENIAILGAALDLRFGPLVPRYALERGDVRLN